VMEGMLRREVKSDCEDEKVCRERRMVDFYS
jgi:hypothetical protein